MYARIRTYRFFPRRFLFSAYVSYNPFLKREGIKKLGILPWEKKNENLKKKNTTFPRCITTAVADTIRIPTYRCLLNITLQLQRTITFETLYIHTYTADSFAQTRFADRDAAGLPIKITVRHRNRLNVSIVSATTFIVYFPTADAEHFFLTTYSFRRVRVN